MLGIWEPGFDYSDGTDVDRWGDAAFVLPIVCLMYKVHIKNYIVHEKRTNNYWLEFDYSSTVPVGKTTKINGVQFNQNIGVPMLSEHPQDAFPTLYIRFIGQCHYESYIPPGGYTDYGKFELK